MRKTLSFLLLLAATLVPPAQAHHTTGPIKFSAVLTLTGQWAYLGMSELRGLQLAVEQINARGGLLTHAIELAYEDDGGDPGKAADIARRLANAESTDILIGGSRTRTSTAIAVVAERARIPFIALGLSSRLGIPGGQWVFQIAPTEEHAVHRVLTDMAKHGIKRIGLLSEDSEFGAAGRREVRLATHPQGIGIKRYGITLGFDAAYEPNVDSIAKQLAAFQRVAGLDALFVFGAGEGPALVMRELRRAGLAVRVYQSHGVAAQEFLAIAGAAAEGVRVPSPPVLAANQLPAGDPRKALLMEFIAAFQARFADPPSSFAGYGYDAVQLGLDAIRRVTSSDFEMMRRSIELTRGLAGISGTYNLWPDNHTGLGPDALIMLEVKDGAFRIAD